MVSFYGGSSIKKQPVNPNLAEILTGTSENWNANPSLVSKLNTIYVYSNYRTKTQDDGSVEDIPGIKIGDGKAYVIDLPFVGDLQIVEKYLVTPEERERWNRNVTVWLSDTDGENLVFTDYSEP